MKFGNRQKGMGIGAWLLTILIFGSGLTLGLKLVPVYMDHQTMVSILTKMSQEGGMTIRGNNQLRDEIQRRFRLNNIRDFNLKDNIQFERDVEGITMTLVYAEQFELIHNLTLVADFNEQFRLED